MCKAYNQSVKKNKAIFTFQIFIKKIGILRRLGLMNT